MRTFSVLTSLVITAFMMSCNYQQSSTEEFNESNPFFAPSKLPFQAPDFSKIKNSDFKPAFEAGMQQQQAEVAKIADNTEAPTFENTLVALEKTGLLLRRVNGVFNLLSSANTNDDLQKVQADEAPLLAANQDAIYLNSNLFKRIQAVYAQKDKLNLDQESEHLLEWYYEEFTLAGAALPDSAKAKLKELNKEEAGLSANFTKLLLAGTKAAALAVSDTTALRGLSSGAIAAAAQNAKAAKQDGKWLLSIQNTTQQPALQSLTNRDTRQKLFEASWTRTEKSDSNDTRKVILRIAQIRAEKANLLGFKNYADWKLRDQMAKTPEAVANFMSQLVPAATTKAKEEAADIQALIDKQKGGFALQPYDWNFYAEQVRKAKYDLDENEVKPYFELNKVLQDGVFYAANQLYGLTFKERHDLPVYQPDVRVFDVFDKDGSQLGLFYCDYFKRDNKSGGAWMDNMVVQSKLLGLKPVIYNVCNFTKPAPGEPALISFDDVKTMFHEFGHGLHGLFGSQQFPSISGTNTARDFVEFPSQFNENWALYPKVFAHFAVHYKTGAPMPQALVDKIKKAGTFNQGYALTEALAAAELDLQWHTLGPKDTPTDADKFETDALHTTKLDLPQVPPRYRSSYFLHIWANGYAAGYYAYAWTEMLDHDAFQWFLDNGGLTRANGQRFRDMVLSRGNTEDYGKMFRDFTGHDPDIKPMLVFRGLAK